MARYHFQGKDQDGNPVEFNVEAFANADILRIAKADIRDLPFWILQSYMRDRWTVSASATKFATPNGNVSARPADVLVLKDGGEWSAMPMAEFAPQHTYIGPDDGSDFLKRKA
jgi:hypothetical protein